MPVYRTNGTLTGTIEPENVQAAQEYLLYDREGGKLTPSNMHQYLDPPLEGVVVFLEWTLHSDGHNYHVTAVTTRDLTEDELKKLSSEVSGQNSDGLGEGFEQQDFAETCDEDEEYCGQCNGNGTVPAIDEEDGERVDVDCPECDGQGSWETENYGMISFDWKTNELPWEKIS